MTAPVLDGTGNQPTQIGGRYYIIGADGAEHPLGHASDGFRSTDDAGYLFQPSDPSAYPSTLSAWSSSSPAKMAGASGVIVDSHGIRYTPTSITDLDGNSISLGNQIMDSVGRTIPSSVGTSALTACPSIAGAVDQPLESAFTWNVPGANGDQTYTFCYVSVSVSTHLINPGTSDQYRDTFSALQSVILPNGQHWGFVYDSSGPDNLHGLGQLTKLIYPTGGSVSYTYSTGSGYCDGLRALGYVNDGVSIISFPQIVNTRTMADNTGAILGTWTYNSFNPDTSNVASVLSPNQELTVTSFTPDPADLSGCKYFPSGEIVYKGSTTATPILHQTATTFSYATVLDSPKMALPRPGSVVTTLDNGQQSTSSDEYLETANFTETRCSTTDYTNCQTSSPIAIPVGGSTSVSTYDFDGTLLRKEATVHKWATDSSYLAANLMQIPASTSILDASGTKQAGVDYTYDEQAYILATGGGPALGHVTSAQPYLNTGSIPPAHTAWKNGMAVGTLDAMLHKNSHQFTQYSLLDQCSGSQVSDSYDALDHHSSATYNCGSGQIASSTDQNNQITTYSYDSSNRLLTITYPAIMLNDGTTKSPKTTFAYDDTNRIVTQTVRGYPNADEVTTATFDSFGRQIQQTHGGTIVDTTYDLEPVMTLG